MSQYWRRYFYIAFRISVALKIYTVLTVVSSSVAFTLFIFITVEDTSNLNDVKISLFLCAETEKTVSHGH